jgi:hypothetical protein
VLLSKVPFTSDSNWIYIRPLASGEGWVNVTMPGHYFYSGTVTNTVTSANGVTVLTTVGVGNTDRWFQNDTLGYLFFQASQNEAINAFLLHSPRRRIGSEGTCN